MLRCQQHRNLPGNTAESRFQSNPAAELRVATHLQSIPNLRIDGYLSISIPVLSALHLTQPQSGGLDGASGEQDGELDAPLWSLGIAQDVRRCKDPAPPNRGLGGIEFSIALPLLVVFVVGIYDFSGAFNQKQKIELAAQEGAIVAGAQPTSDIYVGNGNPPSLQPVVAAVFNSLAGSGVLPLANQVGGCSLNPLPTGSETAGTLIWIYTINGCAGGSSGDQLIVTINRGLATVASGSSPTTYALGTSVTVSYPYHWRFNSAIQLLFPGAGYAAVTNVTESATVHNQM